MKTPNILDPLTWNYSWKDDPANAKFLNCVICTYKDYLKLKDLKATSTMFDGRIVELAIFPDSFMGTMDGESPGHFYIIVDGNYEGCWGPI